MRTTKRFTPQVLGRFRRECRGEGTLADYLPWHRVGRGDPASKGRSHLVPWRDRQRELLSDLEWVTFIFVTMMSDQVLDVREQFPLALNDRDHELRAYDCEAGISHPPGTLALAKAMQIKHPRITGVDAIDHWVMTTDLLVTIRDDQRRPSLLAVSCKFDDQAKLKRPHELLSLERAYWQARQVPWLLITPALFDESVTLTLRRLNCWVFESQCSVEDRQIAAEIAFRCVGRSLTVLLQQLQHRFGSMERAQIACFQSVWAGEIPLDLRRTWRNDAPIKLLTPSEFWALNPVASRRTSWI